VSKDDKPSRPAGVQQVTKVELIINLKTATRAAGVTRDSAAAEQLLSRAAEEEHPGARRELQRLRAEHAK
jgi:uncharacterized protein HemY